MSFTGFGGSSADFEGKSILITGGTGSFGKTLMRRLLDDHNPRKIIVFARGDPCTLR